MSVALRLQTQLFLINLKAVEIGRLQSVCQSEKEHGAVRQRAVNGKNYKDAAPALALGGSRAALAKKHYRRQQ